MSCDDSGTLSVSYIGGVVEYACATSGGTCDGIVGCKRDDCENISTDCFAERCLDDTRLELCMHREKHVIDCTTYGFTRCEESPVKSWAWLTGTAVCAL